MWVDKILLRFKITPTDKILLEDSLGLFRMDEVRDYLLTKGFKVFDVSSLTELSKISRNNQRGLFFFADSNIPNSIKERFNYIQITKNNLSYDIDPKLIENINNTELVWLLSQVYQTNFTQSISLDNYQEILYQAEQKADDRADAVQPWTLSVSANQGKKLQFFVNQPCKLLSQV